MRVRRRLTKARHAAISYEVVEWSEQLRLVTSVWLGAVRQSVQTVRLYDTLWCDCSTPAYDHSDPEELG